MSAPKWTAGPWVAIYDERGYASSIEAPGDEGVPGAVGHVIRKGGFGFPSSDAGKANAALCSAAPDIYSALRELHDYLDEHVHGLPMMVRARKAMRKAAPR